MQSIESVPTWFADTWDISLEAAQVILSTVVILAILLPVLILTRGKGLTIPAIMLVLSEVILVGVGWIPSWVVIITIVIVALSVARFGTNLVTGG